jgi:hypothetical protein
VQPSIDASADTAERGADFYRLDHELMFFGPNAPASTAEERGADFYRLDHELAFFGRSTAEKRTDAVLLPDSTDHD